MKMEIIQQKGMIVPFGKYKGQPVEVLREDAQYMDWLLGQNWFREKYQLVYNVIINNFGEPTETPEHNQMQVKFLKPEWRAKLAFIIDSDLFKYDNASVDNSIQNFFNEQVPVIEKIVKTVKIRLQLLKTIIKEHSSELLNNDEFTYSLPASPFARYTGKEIIEKQYSYNGKENYLGFGNDPREQLKECTKEFEIFWSYFQEIYSQLEKTKDKEIPNLIDTGLEFEKSGFDVSYNFCLHNNFELSFSEKVNALLQQAICRDYEFRMKKENSIFGEGEWYLTGC